MVNFFFNRKPLKPSVKTSLGIFNFDMTGWMTNPSDVLIIQWLEEQFDVDVIPYAEQLLDQINLYAERAKRHIKSVSEYADAFSEDALTLEAVEITKLQDGKFGLTFGVADEPDFTVSIEFADGEPVEVWGGD